MNIQVYKEQFVPLMKVIISKIVDGSDLQRGATIGIGTHAVDDAGSLVMCQMQLMKK